MTDDIQTDGWTDGHTERRDRCVKSPRRRLKLNLGFSVIMKPLRFYQKGKK